MQLTDITYFALAAALLMTGVEGLPRGIGGGRGGKTGGGRGQRAKDAGGKAGDVIGAGSTAAGFIPGSGNHFEHNCCRNAGAGWVHDTWAQSLTVTACKKFTTSQMINGKCTDAAGQAVSGDEFFNECKAITGNDKNVGAGYRGTC